jgi:hypothetical protein
MLDLPLTVHIVPWIDHNFGESIQIGDVTFYPFEQALEAIAPRLRGDFEAKTSYFYEEHSLSWLIRNLRDASDVFGDYELAREAGKESQSDSPLELSPLQNLRRLGDELSPPKPLRPLIAFSADDIGKTRVSCALDVWAMATIIRNESGAFNATSTLFQSFGQSLGGESGFVADVRTTLTGTSWNMFYGPDRVELRPHHAGHFHGDAEPDFMQALYMAAMLPEGEHIARALEAFRFATSQSPDLSPTVLHTMFAAAATEIIFTSGPDKAAVLEKKRINKLLKPILGVPTNTTDRLRPSEPPRHAITRAWYVLRNLRNNWWHPNVSLPATGYRLQRQRLVSPMLISLRVVYALALARLAEMSLVAYDSELIADVIAIERWLGHLGPELEDGLPPFGTSDIANRMAWNERSRQASHLGNFLADERFRIRFKRHLEATQLTI